MNFEIAPIETEIQANWYDAKVYCSSLNIDGKKGWRLPTRAELYQIYKSNNDFDKDWYWSSAECDGKYAWIWGFYDGYQGNYNKYYGTYQVRAVRDII